MNRIFTIGTSLWVSGAIVSIGCSSDDTSKTGATEAHAGTDSAGGSKNEGGASGAAGDESSAGESGTSHQADGNAGSGTEARAGNGSASACDPGELGCDCYGNGTCDSGLTCVADECVECSEGALNCECYGNGTCDDGLVCAADTCVDEGTSGAGGQGGAGGLVNSGGTADVTGGTSASTGGTSENTAGSTDNAGGSSASTGGASDNTGGSSASTGGASDNTGGSSASTGGSSDNTGGSSASTGGASDNTGGSSANTGGSSDNTGGSSGCATGSESCACYGNSSCDPGLVCEANLCSAPIHCEPPTMLDDMEDGDNGICANQGREGGWYTFSGATTATIDPAAGTVVSATALGNNARVDSDYAIAFSGTGFGNTDDDWATLGVSVNDTALYDASVHTGLYFWARAAANLTLWVEFTTSTTRPVADGGTCIETTSIPCNDHFGTFVTIGTSWSQHFVHFGFLDQRGWGQPAALDLTQLHTVHFTYMGDYGGSVGAAFDNPASFTAFIDDVSFGD